MSITITLRGQRYTATDYTLNEVRTLAALFLPGNTELERIESLQSMSEETFNNNKLFGFDLNDPEQSRKATAIIVVRLMNPQIKAQIAYALTSMFPNLPPSIISYRLVRSEDNRVWEDFRYKLEDEELMGIIQELLKHIAAATPERSQPKATTTSTTTKKRKVAAVGFAK